MKVFAVASANKDKVLAFGFGDYVGDEVPPPEIMGPFGAVPTPNPKIVLDNGEVIWGCECWWGPAENEEVINKWLKGRELVLITPAEFRSGSSEAEAAEN